VLNGALPATPVREVFADREIAVAEVQGERSVRIADAFAEFPVAVSRTDSG
jgi:hypothetical protein